jgi:hypothetical protein
MSSTDAIPDTDADADTKGSSDDSVVDAAAAVSLALGVALLVTPGTVGRVLGVEPNRRALRTIGVVDLALAPGLYLGRPRWPWLVARALTNPPIAVFAAVTARTWRARVLAIGLLAATAVDLRTAARLRDSESGPEAD